MRVSFQGAVRQVERDMVVESCRRLCLNPEETTYVLFRYRRSRHVLELVHAMGGSIGDYVTMMVEARAPCPEPVFRLG